MPAVFKEMREVYSIKRLKRRRFNQTPKEYLRQVASEQQKDWNEHIPRFLLLYRYAIHCLKMGSSAIVIFETELKLPGDLEFAVKPATERDVAYIGKEESLNELNYIVSTRIKMVSDKIKTIFQAWMREFPSPNVKFGTSIEVSCYLES